MGWLNRSRVRVYSLGLLGLYLVILFGVYVRRGLETPRVCDFAQFYGAGLLARAGEAARAYADPDLQEALEPLLGSPLPDLQWNYPPVYFLVAVPLTALPYLPSMVLWLLATLAAYARALHALHPSRLTVPAALGFPAVVLNFSHGQNGLFTAALLAGGLALLDAWPLAAGGLLGALAYKPHLAALVPLALLASGRWRALAATLASAALLTGLATLLFGPGTWPAFFAKASRVSATLADSSGEMQIEKFTTVYGALRVLGAPAALGKLVQGAVTLGCLALVVWVFRRGTRTGPAAATLTMAGLLATPWCLEYDLALLAIPLVLLAAEAERAGTWRRGEKATLLAAWGLPFYAPLVARHAGVPLAPVVLAAVLACVLRRALEPCGGGAAQAAPAGERS